MVVAPMLLAAQGSATGVIAGRVTIRADTGVGKPHPQAIVTVIGTTLGAATNGDGRFVLDRVPARLVTVRARAFGFKSAEQSVRVEPGDTLIVEFALEIDAQLLKPMLAVARSDDAITFAMRPNVATTTMRADEFKGIPSVGERDVMRIAQLLPGVEARNDFSSGLNVRGGEADQNLILLDGYPIYNPFHLGGLFGTFMDATVGGIELMTAAFPAQFGGRLSSVLDVRSAEDSRSSTHGSADISALAATARLTGSFRDGNGHWSIAGRRTYADAVTSLFTNTVFPYHFRDFHGHATYVFSNDLRLAVTAYTGKDVLDANFAELEADSVASRSGEGRWGFDWGNLVVGATLLKTVGQHTTLVQRVSTSGFSTRLDVGEGTFTQRSEIRDVRISGALITSAGAHDLSTGYEVASHRIRYGSGSPQTRTTEFELAQEPVSGAAYVDDLWGISNRWIVQGGLRAEALSGRQWFALSPRASVKFLATPELAFTAAAGRVTQWQHSLAGDGPLRYFDIWIASDSFIPVATAWHYVAGVERRVRDAGSVRVEGYVKRYDRVLDVNQSEDPQRRGDELFVAEGLSYGVDVHARWQPLDGASGWVSYSYGMSTRTRDGVTWSPGHDRRHDINVVATWQLSKYKLGARFGFATGTPYTPIIGGITRRVYDPSLDRWGTGEPTINIESLGGARNSARFPAAHRLDLDVSRELHYRGATLSPYLSVANAYNARNVFVYLYSYTTDSPTRRAISQFPVLPSAGVRIAF